MDGYLGAPLAFLVKAITGLYILAVMLRFLLGVVRADFYNPISQFLVRVTNPPLVFLRRFIPPFRRLDTASIVLLLLLQMGTLGLIAGIRGGGIDLSGIFILSVAELLNLVIDIFFFSILIQAILSWVNPGAYNPATALLFSLTRPILRPAQRLLPPIGGLDLSPVLAMIALKALEMLLIPPLLHLL